MITGLLTIRDACERLRNEAEILELPSKICSQHNSPRQRNNCRTISSPKFSNLFSHKARITPQNEVPLMSVL